MPFNIRTGKIQRKSCIGTIKLKSISTSPLVVLLKSKSMDVLIQLKKQPTHLQGMGGGEREREGAK
jgi:hypothetical protein